MNINPSGILGDHQLPDDLPGVSKFHLPLVFLQSERFEKPFSRGSYAGRLSLFSPKELCRGATAKETGSERERERGCESVRE